MKALRTEIKVWAIAGAKARLAEVELERGKILHFLDAMKGLEQAPAAGPKGPDLHKIRKVVKRVEKKRSNMTAAARKAVSVRMKKYWADRRKQKSKKK